MHGLGPALRDGSAIDVDLRSSRGKSGLSTMQLARTTFLRMLAHLLEKKNIIYVA